MRRAFWLAVDIVTLLVAVMGPACTFGAMVCMVVAPETGPFWLAACVGALAWAISWERIGERR